MSVNVFLNVVEYLMLLKPSTTTIRRRELQRCLALLPLAGWPSFSSSPVCVCSGGGGGGGGVKIRFVRALLVVV